jgi:hypothetical protein
MGKTLTISTIIFIGSVLWAGINLYLAFILLAVGIIWHAGKSFLRALNQQHR